jgi:hypothetical protein
MIDLRKKNKGQIIPRSHPDFDFVKPGVENVFMVGLGCKSGIVFTEADDYDHFSREKGLHRFIRCYDMDTIDRFKDMQENLIEKLYFRSTARLLSCTQKDVIETYIEHYPERVLGTDLTKHSE